MKYIKTFENKKENYLKEYSQFLLSEYIKINPSSENSRIYSHLTNFVKTGTIKNLIYKNTSLKDKINTLDGLAYNIKTFMKDNNVDSDIIFYYAEFVDFIKSKLTLSEYMSLKKYNL